MDKITINSLDKNSIINLIGKSYFEIGDELSNSRKNIINKIITNKALPEEGLDEMTIEMFLNTIASMDSNNGLNRIGIGEREGRIFSNLVKKRNFGLIHGMGRSGNVTELQPKAVGSSLLVQLTNSLLLNLLRDIGMNFLNNLIVLPFATGMAITLSFLTIKLQKPNAKYVIWPRIDQKTCFKSMFTANLTPIVIEPILDKLELTTNLDEIEKQIKLYGADNIHCIFSTTSCFAPRGYDKIKEIAKLCKTHNIHHVVNNAYGITCTKVTDLLSQANSVGRIDVIISSSDKNFMVPVGGSLLYSGDVKMVDSIKKNYPGRASIAPIVDLFITLLEMGKLNFKNLIKERKQRYIELKEVMEKVGKFHDEKIIDNPNNKISIAMSLGNICINAKNKSDITKLGSFFYKRQISGIRILSASEEIDFNGFKFKNYGSHSNNYPILPYVNFAAAIGITHKEIIDFANKFDEIVTMYKKSLSTPIVKEIDETKYSSIEKKDIVNDDTNDDFDEDFTNDISKNNSSKNESNYESNKNKKKGKKGKKDKKITDNVCEKVCGKECKNVLEKKDNNTTTVEINGDKLIRQMFVIHQGESFCIESKENKEK